MNGTLFRALVLLLPASWLLYRSLVLLISSRTVASSLQLFGAAGFVIVVIAHICEALNLLPWMHWGLQRSPGHYLDLTSAIVGLILFPIGYLLQTISKRHA
jgi:hypothetical protein